MFYVVQNNLYRELAYHDLMAQLVRRDLPHAVVKPIAIAHKLVPIDFDSHAYKGDVADIPDMEINYDGNIIVMGAITLSNIAVKRGWKPGSFLNDDFTFEKWRKNFGTNLLNHDSIVCQFSDVTNHWDTFFIRPCEDTKSFNGMVINWGDGSWKDDMLDKANEFALLMPDTLVSYCSVKEIYREYRFFVIDGKVITGSQYKIGNRVLSDSTVDDDITQFAQQMVDTWQPARAFVIDIAMTPEGFKVIEINNFNSAGFYACNISKIIDALEDMKF